MSDYLVVAVTWMAVVFGFGACCLGPVASRPGLCVLWLGLVWVLVGETLQVYELAPWMLRGSWRPLVARGFAIVGFGVLAWPGFVKLIVRLTDEKER